MENMELWNQVCETDPDTTRPVDTRGGFTSICAQAQLKRATSVFESSYGDSWVVRDCKWEMIYDNGTPVQLCLDAEFSYPDGHFEISSDIAFSASGDLRKKLLTDVTTKALSKLGFNSDVFEGRFDDDKYVQGMREKHSKPPSEDSTERFFAAINALKDRGWGACGSINIYNKYYREYFGGDGPPISDLKTYKEQEDYFDNLEALVKELEDGSSNTP